GAGIDDEVGPGLGEAQVRIADAAAQRKRVAAIAAAGDRVPTVATVEGEDVASRSCLDGIGPGPAGDASVAGTVEKAVVPRVGAPAASGGRTPAAGPPAGAGFRGTGEGPRRRRRAQQGWQRATPEEARRKGERIAGVDVAERVCGNREAEEGTRLYRLIRNPVRNDRGVVHVCHRQRKYRRSGCARAIGAVMPKLVFPTSSLPGVPVKVRF